MRKVGKTALYVSADSTNSAPSLGDKWQPVGDADFVLINHSCTGTTAVVWEFYTLCDDGNISPLSFVGLDTTFPPDPSPGEHTTSQGANEQPLLFDVRGVDGYFVRYKTRVGGDESFSAMATLCKTSQ